MGEPKENILTFAKFEDAGLHPIVESNVKKCGYETPTPVQAYVIPSVLKGKDVIGVAQTGEHHA